MFIIINSLSNSIKREKELKNGLGF